MRKALLVIDVQQEYFEGPYRIEYPDNSLDNIMRALRFAESSNITTVVIRHTSKSGKHFVKKTPGWELRPEIGKFRPDLYVEKRYPGSFTNTNLETWLRDGEIDTVTIAGYMTHMCCDTTARQAFHLGFNVEFLSDATGTVSLKLGEETLDAQTIHKAFLAGQASQFSRVLSVKEWMAISGR